MVSWSFTSWKKSAWIKQGTGVQTDFRVELKEDAYRKNSEDRGGGKKTPGGI